MSTIIKRLKSKYHSLPATLRASFFFVISGAMKDAVDILTTPVFTRILTQEEYGLFNVYNSYYQILRILVSLYIFSDGFNVGMARFGEDKEGFTSSMLGLGTALFAVWAGVLLIGRNLWTGLTGLGFGLLALMLFQILFTTSFNCWRAKKKYQYDYRVVPAVTVIYLFVQPLAGLALIWMNRSGLNNGILRIYGGVGVQIAFGAVIFLIQFIRKPVFFRKKYWGFALKTSIPLLPHFLSQILLNHSDRLMIDQFAGKAQTAIYSVAHAAAFALFAITSNLNGSFVPWFYERLKKKNTEGIRSIISALVILTASVSLVLVLVAPEVIRILGGSKYDEGIWIIPPLTFGVFLIFVYTLFADVELFYGKNYYVLIASVVGAGANILLNYLLIPRYGYFAAGYTTVAGYLLMCLFHFCFLRVTCRKEELKLSELYPVPFIAAAGLVLAVLFGAAMWLYPYAPVRYGCLLLIIAAAVLKRKTLISLYHRIKDRKG